MTEAALTPHIDTRDASLPATYSAARTALEQCVKVDEVKDWGDKAAALKSYAKQSQDDELWKMAARIQGRAIRRVGQLLKEIEPAKGGRPRSGWICPDCGEEFGISPELRPGWHCPVCDHHHGCDRAVCNNCHEGKRPKPGTAGALVSRSTAARDAGLSDKQRKTALRVANVEQAVDQVMAILALHPDREDCARHVVQALGVLGR